MSEQDEPTQRYYRNNAQQLYARYESVPSPVAALFKESFIPGGRVLDVGCGSGRDLRALLNQGYDAYGVEPCAELRQLACSEHPELAGRLYAGTLPTLASDQRYDGLLCSAVLMHLPAQQHSLALANLRELLKTDGSLLLSVPNERADATAHGRDTHGRLFETLESRTLLALAEKAGLSHRRQFDGDDALNRTGVSWVTHLFTAT